MQSFNNLRPSKREDFVSAPLVCAGAQHGLETLGITLNDGMDVLLYEPDPDFDGNPADSHTIDRSANRG